MSGRVGAGESVDQTKLGLIRDGTSVMSFLPSLPSMLGRMPRLYAVLRFTRFSFQGYISKTMPRGRNKEGIQFKIDRLIFECLLNDPNYYKF